MLLLVASPLIIVSFQNCAPASFSRVENEGGGDLTPGDGPTDPGDPDDPITPPPAVFQLREQLIMTGFNEPVDWTAGYVGPRTTEQLSFDGVTIKSDSLISQVGRLEIINAQTWLLRFTPVNGYKGELRFWLFAHREGQSVSQAQITIQVGSSVNMLTPALAVRAGGCVMCHAEVHANIVTDFGFGNPFYFGSNVPSGFSWNDGSPYGDHESLFTYSNGQVGLGAWARLKLFDGVQQLTPGRVFVPTVDLPPGPKAATGKNRLKGYLEHRFAASEYATTKKAQIIERSSVVIRAPSSSRLLEAFQWSASDEVKRFKFIADPGAWALSGINAGVSAPSQNFFKNTGVLVCEGDLLIHGNLLLDRVQLRTRKGCRIYVTGDIYISGPIQYLTDGGQDYSKRNIQLTASRSILMGLGQLWKNGQHCEQGIDDSGYWGYYANRNEWTKGMSASQKAAFEENIANSAKYRMRYFWGIPNFTLRGVSSPVAHSEAIYQDFIARVPGAMDAACEPEARDVYYERILLNAPLIHSRYAGGVRGSVIAEFALMPLGLSKNQSRFRFEFDPVFSQVEVLPLLKDQDFLKVE